MSQPAWTPERRALQAEVIRRARPWEKSTGPTSERGKARAAQNGRRPGSRRELARIRAALRAHAAALNDLVRALTK